MHCIPFSGLYRATLTVILTFSIAMVKTEDASMLHKYSQADAGPSSNFCINQDLQRNSSQVYLTSSNLPMLLIIPLLNTSHISPLANGIRNLCCTLVKHFPCILPRINYAQFFRYMQT